MGSKKAGRPKGEEDTVVIAVRIPVSLREKLDRYLDRLEDRTGIKSNRGAMCRHALRKLLDSEDI